MICPAYPPGMSAGRGVAAAADLTQETARSWFPPGAPRQESPGDVRLGAIVEERIGGRWGTIARNGIVGLGTADALDAVRVSGSVSRGPVSR